MPSARLHSCFGAKRCGRGPLSCPLTLRIEWSCFCAAQVAFARPTSQRGRRCCWAGLVSCAWLRRPQATPARQRAACALDVESNGSGKPRRRGVFHLHKLVPARAALRPKATLTLRREILSVEPHKGKKAALVHRMNPHRASSSPPNKESGLCGALPEVLLRRSPGFFQTVALSLTPLPTRSCVVPFLCPRLCRARTALVHLVHCDSRRSRGVISTAPWRPAPRHHLQYPRLSAW